MTTRSVHDLRIFSTKVLTKVQFECPAIVNTLITGKILQSITISWHIHRFYNTNKSHSTTHFIKSIPNATHAYRELCTKPRNHIMFNLQNTFEGDIFVDITRPRAAIAW